MVGGHDRHQSPAQSRPNLSFCNEVESAEFFNTTMSATAPILLLLPRPNYVSYDMLIALRSPPPSPSDSTVQKLRNTQST
jgi:hypothetical protein